MTIRDWGHFDEVSPLGATGWAINPDNDADAATVDVFIDAEFVGEVRAELFRDDLLSHGLRDGYAGFCFQIPFRYDDGRDHTVQLVQHRLKTPLPDSPKTFNWAVPTLPLLQERAAWAADAMVITSSLSASRIARRIRQRRRLAILSTHHAAPRFLAYHHALVDALTRLGFVVHVVHAAGNFAPTLRAIESEDVFLTVKRNIGYDFGSWAVAIFENAVHFRHLDELVLMNDSVIGPVNDLAAVFDRVRAANADVVGLTDSFEISYHLQSYFLWFGRAACRSPLLPVFMSKYSFSSDKDAVIREGELGLTKFIIDAGFSTHAVFPYESVAGAWLAAVPELLSGIAALPVIEPGDHQPGYKESLRRRIDAITSNVIEGVPANPTHFFWDVLVTRMGFPFLKREMVFANPSAVPSYHRISEVLDAAPERVRADISELRRVFGGTKALHFPPEPAAPPGGKVRSLRSA